MGRHKDLANELNGNTKSLPEDYSVRLALARLREVEENSERLFLDNQKKRVEINKTNCNLCYIDYAESQISAALAPIANILKSLDQILATRLNLTGAQTETVQEEINNVLHQLAAIEIKLKSTEEVDAEKLHSSAVERETAIKAASKARKIRDKK